MAEYSLYDRNDIKKREDYGIPGFKRYRLALDSEGWRIVYGYTQHELIALNDWRAQSGLNRITEINTYCDLYVPRIEKTPSP